MSANPGYPVALAAEDFVPTLLALAGFWILAGAGARPAWSRAGAALIGAGGLAKALWKLLPAAFGVDLAWLEASLFPLMALGACVFFAGVLRPWWPLAVLYVAAAAFGLLFVLATAGVTAISVYGAIVAARRRTWAAVAVFVLGIALVMALVPLRASATHETLGTQWLEQSTNTLAQAALVLAAWLTTKAPRKETA